MYLMGLWGISACIQADSWMIKYRLVTTAAERVYAARSPALKKLSLQSEPFHYSPQTKIHLLTFSRGCINSFRLVNNRQKHSA